MTTPSFSSQPDGVTITSTSLIQRIQLNEDAAWGRFVDLYSPLIWGWCRGMGLGSHDADDVGQEVFSAVNHAIVRYTRNGSFRGWLWQITRNKIMDHFRSRQKRPRAAGGSDFGNWLQQIPESPPEETSDSTSGDLVMLRALDLIREEFEESTWTAFFGMVLEKRSATEIAIDLGWAGRDGADAVQGAKRVRQAKYRVAKRLREEFGEVLDLD